MTTPQTGRELLELAAKAAGLDTSHKWNRARMEMEPPVVAMVVHDAAGSLVTTGWNPLDNSGHALNLAVKLNLDIGFESYDAGIAVIVGGAWDDAPEGVHEIFERDGPRATRRAIVRAAAEIGRAMP